MASSTSLQETKPYSSLLLRLLAPSSLLLLLNSIMLLIGGGGPLLLRVYFNHGGTRIWLSSLLQVCGWPILLPPILLYYHTNPSPHPAARRHLSPLLLSASVFLGFLNVLNSYLYSYGSSRLPLSTSSLVISSQLVFTSVFSFFIVGQRFTAPLLNAVVMLTVAPVVLSLGMSSDRQAGETTGMYAVGFLMTLGAAALVGLLLPLIELTYRKTRVKVTYGVVMEVMLAMGVSGTIFCLLGMIVAKDFQAIPREAKEFGLGEMKYYMILVWDGILFQIFNLGLIGIISCASSLVGGLGVSIVLPIGEVLAVIFLHEKFTGGKGVALALSLWGFASYVYGEKIQSQKIKEHQSEIHIPSVDEA